MILSPSQVAVFKLVEYERPVPVAVARACLLQCRFHMHTCDIHGIEPASVGQEGNAEGCAKHFSNSR